MNKNYSKILPKARHDYSPDEISRIGERLYFDKLKDELEKEHSNEYLVIDVETKHYVVDPDMLAAINKAKEKFGDKMFHIIQIGTLEKPTINYRKLRYAWKF